MIRTISWLIPGAALLVALVAWGTLAYGARRAQIDPATRRRFVFASGGILFGWLALSLGLATGGFLQAASDRAFPALLLAFVTPLAGGLLLMRHSTVLKAALDAIPVSWLTGIQLYRVVGAVFLALLFADLMPPAFALPAGAGDLAVGLAAPVVAWLYYARARGSGAALLGWNLVGLLALAVAVTTGVLTSPGPIQALAHDAPNPLITAWPLAIVPAFAVPLSILLHLAVLRRLKSEMTPVERPQEGWISRLVAL